MIAINSGGMVSIEEVQAMITDVDDNGDGSIQMPEFLKLVSDNMKTKKNDEEMVELFKAFGGQDRFDVITIADLDKGLKQGGESLCDHDLTLIFEELAGAYKRADQIAERRYVRATGLNFNDFLLMMLPK